MKPANLLILILAAVLTASSCKESITDSRPRIIRPPQEMIWTADTIRGIGTATQLLPQNLLVFSAKDAWLTCWSDIARGLIWHWDGKSWNESDIRKDVGGMRVRDLEGYSSSDLWVCGYSGEEIFLAHYNGTKWTKYNTNGIQSDLLDMCKDADGNIWACGRNGVIMKYDKTKWIYERIDLKKEKEIDYFIKSIALLDNQVHFIISAINMITLAERYYYGRKEDGEWKLKDSILMRPDTKMRWGNFKLLSANKKLYSVGLHGVWRLNNCNWEKIHDFNGELYDISGTGDNYLLVASAYNTFKYYNGIDWIDFGNKLVNQTQYFSFRSVWTNGYETFIAGEGTFGKTEKLVIWRGK